MQPLHPLVSGSDVTLCVGVCDVAEVSFNFEHERQIININYMLSGVCRG